MNKSKKIVSIFLIIFLVFSSIQLPYIKNEAISLAYAAGHTQDILYSSKYASDISSMVAASSGYTDAELVDMDWAYLGEYYGDIAVNQDYIWIDDVTQDINLIKTGKYGSTISWVSTNEDVLTSSGEVTRPTYYNSGVEVNFKVTITSGETSITKDFYANVPQLTSAEVVALDRDRLIYDTILQGNSADDVKTNLYLPTYGSNGSTIEWSSSNPAVVGTDGKITKPAKNQESASVTLTAKIYFSYFEYAEDFKTFDIKIAPIEEIPLALKFEDFSNCGELLEFNGISGTVDAIDGDGNSVIALQLSNEAPYTGGSIFTKNRIHLKDDLSFSTFFTYRDVHTDNTVGNGGITFTLQTVGNSVYGEDLQGASGINPSLNIVFEREYNIYQTSQGPYYSFDNQVKLYSNGNTEEILAKGQLTGTQTSNDPQNVNYVWIEYDGTDKILKMWFTDNTIPPDLECSLDLTAILTGGSTVEDARDVYVGFTGSAGEAAESIEISKWYFENDTVPIQSGLYEYMDASNVTLTANPPGGHLNSTLTVSVSGSDGSVAGIPVAFSTDFGSIETTSIVETVTPGLTTITQITDSSGNASFAISSDTAGTALVKAITASGTMVSKQVEFAVSDEDRVAFDSEWLTNGDGLVELLNGNSSLDNITISLKLPEECPGGSTVTWDLGNYTNIVAPDGTVTTPTPIDGDQAVMLMAKIINGTAMTDKTFNLTVKVKDEDYAVADSAWLTDTMVLDGNSDMGNVLTNLNMPVTANFGSIISWTSTDENIVVQEGADIGRVNRPAYSDGDSNVTLTASIVKNSIELNKVFDITVKSLPPSDTEVDEDEAWLVTSRTLGDNLSQYSINSDLELPLMAPNGSIITWESDMPDIIEVKSCDNESFYTGKVTRPSYLEGYKSVTLTAVLSLGSGQDAKIRSKELNYTVLALPDTDSPMVTGMTPKSGSTVLWNIRQIAVTFNEDVSVQADAIKLQGSDTPEYSVFSYNNQLIIDIVNYMEPGQSYELVIPQDSVADKSGNNLTDELRLPFTLEEKTVNEIEVVSSTPAGMEKQITLRPDISFKYSYDKISKGTTFSSISLFSGDGDEVSFSSKLTGDTVTIILNEDLKPGTVYELNIPADAVVDRFENESFGKVIKFRTEGSGIISVITGTYPLDGQKEVDIHQNVDVYFTEDIDPLDCSLTLLDGGGNPVSAGIYELKGEQNGVSIQPYVPLEPNTVYTVTGPYDSTENPSGVVFEMSFRTGPSSLGINYITTTLTDENNGASIDSQIKILFSSLIARGPEVGNIRIIDHEDNPVFFTISETFGGAVILTPASKLKSSETYTVHIPKGAYKDLYNNGLNDSLDFSFTTAKKIVVGNDVTFKINPSAVSLKEKQVKFNAMPILIAFHRNESDIDSFEWDFGDGEIGSGEFAEHTYNIVGEYEVTLTVKDWKGFYYEFKRNVTVEDYNVDQVGISISPWYHDAVSLVNDNYNYKQYTINLSYPGAYMTDENIDIYLSKVGQDGKEVLKYYLKTVTTGNGDKFHYDSTTRTGYSDLGMAFFNFSYKDFDPGTYELIFTYSSQGREKTARVPVTIIDMRTSKPIKIKLYNVDTEKQDQVNYYNSLYLIVDGEKELATRKYDEDAVGYIYETENIDIGWHNVELDSSGTGMIYYSEELNIDHGFQDIFTLPVKFKQPGLQYIKSEISDSRNQEDTLFIRGVSTGTLKFEFTGNWNNLTPGYYEIRKSEESTHIIRTKDPYYEIDPGLYMLSGERLQVRMVSSRFTSDWMDAGITVVDPPYLTYADGASIAYTPGTDGNYYVNIPINMSELIGGKVSLFDGIPLLDNTQSFGIDSNNMLLGGYIDSTGKLIMDFSGGGSYSSSKKTNITETKMKSVGYGVSADMSGRLALIYDSSSQKWKVYSVNFKIDGDGNYYWTRGYEVPKIGVGVNATLTLGSKIGGTLNAQLDDIQPDKLDYSGIIYFTPYVNVSITADAKVGKIEGYVTGSIASEVHLPTGYVQVEPNIRAGINLTAFGFTKSLYQKTLLNEHWDNGKEKVAVSVLNSALKPLENFDTQDVTLELMSRNYLNREPKWLGKSTGYFYAPLIASTEEFPFILNMSSFFEANPSNSLMKRNIYPQSEVRLVKNGDELWMVWIDDNQGTSAINRTQMMYSILKNGTWSEPVLMGQDGTADFSPTVASTGNGVLMAWQNIGTTLPENAAIGDFMENSEISVTQSEYTNGSSSIQLTNLTDDLKFDNSPKIAADGDNALLVWNKSEGLAFTLGEDMEQYKSPANSDSLMFSSWNGSGWTSPAEIEGSLPTVMEKSLTLHEEEGLLLYTLDTDNNQSTEGDRELYARVYKENLWEDSIKITDNQIEDSNPKAVFINGKWFITWVSDGSIVYRYGLEGETINEECLKDVVNSYEITANSGVNPQIALVYRQAGENNTITLFASFYNVDSGLWGNEIQLTEGEGYIRSFSPEFTEDGKLNIAYTKADIVTEVIDGEEYPNTSDKVDLYMLKYTLVHDLAFDDEDDLQLLPEIPVPGATDNVTVTVRNNGDFAEKATVYLYDGSPENGVKIGQVDIEQPIPAKSYVEIETEWLVKPEERDKYDIYAVVEADGGVADVDTSNNTIHREITTADIEITGLTCENPARDDYLVTVEVVNKGSRMLEGIEVRIDQGQNEQAIETKKISKIYSGQNVGFSFFISSKGLVKDENGVANVTISALTPDGVEESSTQNNTLDFMLKPTQLTVRSMNPAQGENKVDIRTPLTFSFNMDAEKGNVFDLIKLEDDNLNLIDIEKTLEGDILTITPKNVLDYNTGYTLTIPEDALGDSYGHTLKESYNISFTTTKSSPEVLFTYPGSEITDIDLDSNISLEFNQNILKGPAFENIIMYGPNSEKVSVLVSLQGEMLNIYPSGNLDENADYSITIPRGAVISNKGEGLLDEYIMTFTTGSMIGSQSADENKYDEQDEYTVSRQISEHGKSRVTVNVSEQSILMLKSSGDTIVKLDLTDDTREDDIVSVNLAADAIKQLAEGDTDFDIVTGKGSIRFPAGLLDSFVGDGNKPIIITISEDNVTTDEDHRVSAGTYDYSIIKGDESVTKFDPLLTVTIPLDMSKVEDARRVIVCVYDESMGAWVPIGGIADASAGTVTFNARHFSTYAAFETSKHFDDVSDSWAKEKVEILASRHLITGRTDNIFDSKGSITRAEFAAILVRSLYTELSTGNDIFTDVGKDDWYFKAVETAYELGLVNGIGGDKFEPNAKITRQQLAVMVYRLYLYRTGKKSVTSISNNFRDNQDISSYAKEAVDFMSASGIMQGSGGKFEPRRTATRQEAAVVMYRLLEYLGEI